MWIDVFWDDTLKEEFQWATRNQCSTGKHQKTYHTGLSSYRFSGEKSLILLSSSWAAMSRLLVELTGKESNKLHTKLTQITAHAGNAPYCYACTFYISINFHRNFTLIQSSSILDTEWTWKLKPWAPMQCWGENWSLVLMAHSILTVRQFTNSLTLCGKTRQLLPEQLNNFAGSSNVTALEKCQMAERRNIILYRRQYSWILSYLCNKNMHRLQ